MGHDYSASVTHPTCTERGYTTHTCSRCTDSYIDTYTDALGHDLIHHYGREATCIEGGWSAYDTCSRCDYTTYSAIPALGHDPIHHDARAATCTDVGWNAYDTCSRCSYSTYQEIAALGHDLVHHDAKAPTCTEIGWNEYDTCSRCNHTTYSELGALGHTWSEWSEITSATEDSEGEEGRECSVCHATDTRPIPKLGHIHQMTFFTANESTCSVQGNSQYWQCTKCGRYYSDENGENEIEAGSWLLPLKEHTLVDDSAVDPTCTATGLTAGSHCSECGTVIVAQNVIPALGHSRQHHAHTDSICTENGNIEYWGCTVCGKCYSDESCTVEISKESTVIAYKGHTEVIDEAVAATCTTAGKTVGKHCSVCGEVLIAQTDVPALGHDLIHHDAKAPTCTEVGWNAYDTCSRCDYSTYSELNALGHNHVATVTQPTCTEKGYTTHTCSRCGDSYIDSYIDALGHAYSATYDWSADGKSCTVHIVCSNDSSHKHDIADIIAVSSIKTVAAIGSMGVTTYSVSGTYDGFAYSDSMDVRNIPALEPEIIQKDVQGETTYSNTVAENQTTQITEIFNTAKTNSSSVEVSVPTAVTESPVIIAFDNDAVNAIGGSEVTITANVVENSTEIEEAELVIEVKLEGATFSEGKAKVTVPLTETVPEGKTVKVYFINGNERIDMNAVLVDGNVVFETNHFSTYAIFFEDAPSDNGSEGFPIVIVIGVVVAIALVSCAVIFLRRH
ncbi:hypothetical protein AOA81_04690 [Methanomassiliicoccales archaeon RumEn M2]|nr:hypothetical protein AOA81_04690 [Methanomassiliicoccales archaeon RumEn M2]